MQKLMDKVRFFPPPERDFLSTVRERVENYFISQGISRYADRSMRIKSVLLLGLAVGLYGAIVFGSSFSKPLLLLLAMGLGIVKGFIGVNISHDALHGAYSASRRANRWLGFTYDFIGLSSYVWKITHNNRHHIYTNIAGMDHDIDKAILLRFNPEDKLYAFHYFQNWYLFLLYPLTGINWVFLSDYLFLYREAKKQPIPKGEMRTFFFFKALNSGIFLFFPLFWMSLPWKEILLGYLGMQLAGGFTVALIFQLAHLVEQTAFPKPDEKGVVGYSWGEHEMRTTANFCTKNGFINYVCGGLNFQIEHHLFPFICHTHYKKIAPIVERTAQEFALPYYVNETFRGAVLSHFRAIKRLGRKA